MKIFTLILIAFSIFLTLIIFIAFIYSINSELNSEMNYEGDSSDTDSQLFPSYHYQILKFNSIYVAGPIILGVISLAFIVPNIILRIKKIPTRKYMLVIAAGILIFFGMSYIQNGLSVLTPEHFEQSSDYRIVLIGALIPIGIGTVPLVLGIIALKKAKLRNRQ